MAVQTAGSFVEILEKSQLLEPGQIKEACEAATNPEDPASIARYLLRKEWVTKWQAALLLKGRHRYKIGKYTIVDQIGAGTDLGQVYVAEHEQMGRRAVVKVLSQNHLKNEELVSRFLEEARKVAALDHRNLAHVFDIGEDGDRYFVVMEHVKGHDLAKLVESNGPFPAAKAASCATQALRGLAHAHEHGIVNGAIEPKNLLLDDNGDLKVLDTGEARLADALKQTLNKKFAAPEQVAGEEPTAASDVFAVGRVLTFIIGGPDKLTGDLRKIVARMTAEKPADRFDDAGKVADLLDKWSAVQSDAAATAEAKPPAAKPPAAKAPPAKANGAKPAKTPAAKSPEPKQRSKDTDAGVANLAETTEFAVDKKKRKKPVFRTDDDAPDAKAPAAKQPAAKAAPAKAKPAPKKKKKAAQAAAAGAALVADDPFAVSDSNAAGLPVDDDPLGDPLAMDPAMVEPQEALETLPVPEEEPVAEPAKSKGVPVALLAAIGGGVALLLLLLVSAVAAGVYMMSSSTTEVAVNADAGPKPPVAPADADAGEGDEDAAEDGEVTNVFGTPGGNPPPPVDGAEDGAVQEDGGEEPAAPQTPEGTKPGGNDPKTDKPAPDKPEPAKPEPEKSDPPKTNDKKPDPKKPDPKKPDPKKPEPKKPEPKPVNPFVGLKGEVELKETSDTSPLILGKVTLNPRERPLVDLEGGENANPGTQKFKLEEVLGTSERRYEIFMLNSRVLEGEAKIAEMFINDQQQVVLQWTTDAAADPVTAYLRNCSVSFTSGRGGHVISLRKQAVTQPLVVDLEAKASPKATVNIPNPPDKSALYVEFELQGKDLPPSQFVGKGNKVGVAPEIEANGGLLYIAFGNPNLLTLRVDSRMSGDKVNITLTPSLGSALNPSGKPQRVNLKDVNAMLAQGRAAYGTLTAQEKAANEFVKKHQNNKAPQAQKQVNAAKQAANVARGNLVAIEAQNKNLQELIELVKKLDKKKVAFRVFLDADGAKNYMSKDQ